MSSSYPEPNYESAFTIHSENSRERLEFTPYSDDTITVNHDFAHGGHQGIYRVPRAMLLKALRKLETGDFEDEGERNG